MDFLKKTIRGVGHCSIFGIGLLGLHIVHKRHLSDYFKIVSYAATCAGLYLLTTYLLEEKDEDGDDDVDETKKEGTDRITAQSVMEELKPALEKQIAVSTKSKPSLEEFEMRLLKEMEEDSMKTANQSSNEDQTESNENLANFQHILKGSSLTFEIENMTDNGLFELMKNYNELSDSNKEYLAQFHPIFMKFRKLNIKLIKSFESESAKKTYLEEISQELKRLRYDTDKKGVTDDTIYYADDNEDEDDSLEESHYENCPSDAESNDSKG